MLFEKRRQRKAETEMQARREEATALITQVIEDLALPSLDLETPEIQQLVTGINTGEADDEVRILLALRDRLLDPRLLADYDSNGILRVPENYSMGFLPTLYSPLRAAEIVLGRPLTGDLGRVTADADATHLFTSGNQEFAYFEAAKMRSILPEQSARAAQVASDEGGWHQSNPDRRSQMDSERYANNVAVLVGVVTDLTIDKQELFGKSELTVTLTDEVWQITELA